MFFGKYDQKTAETVPNNGAPPDLPLEIEILYNALDKLPSKQKEAIVLFEISGFSQLEICKIQRCTLSAVKSRIKRGKEKLVQILVTYESTKTSLIYKIKAI